MPASRRLSVPTPAAPGAAGDPERWLLDHLGDVHRIAATIARRHALSADDADEYEAWARSRLIDNDFAIIRRFQGRSSFSTYLAVVLTNLFRDYRNSIWGRWRASAAAQRLGAEAVKLEALLYRDGMSIREAMESVKQHGSGSSDRELSHLVMRIPQRPKEREVTIDATHAIASSDYDAIATERERATLAEAIREAVGELGDEDRIITRMRFWDDVPVADIARALHLEQKPLYRRLERIQEHLRRALERRGITRDVAIDVITEVTLW